MQAAIRSIIATALLFAWARLRGIVLFQRDGAFGPGIAAGLLFAAQFVFIYGGLAYQGGVVFLREPLSGYFALAAVLVAAGIVLVNLRR